MGYARSAWLVMCKAVTLKLWPRLESRFTLGALCQVAWCAMYCTMNVTWTNAREYFTLLVLYFSITCHYFRPYMHDFDLTVFENRQSTL